jgi:MFS family permease
VRRPGAGLPREVLVLTAVAFSVAVGFGVVAPALPIFAKQFGVDNTAAGAVISAFAFMRLVSALGSGRLVNRLGERVILATGIAIVAVSSALAGLSQSYEQLLLLRGIGGVGSAMFTVSAISLLLRVVDADQRGRATGMWQSGFLLGGIAGPTIGGPLTDISLRAPFFVYAATLAVAGSIGMLFLTHTPLHDREVAEQSHLPRTTVGQALRISGYRAALLCNLGSGWALFGVRSSLIPLFVTEALGKSSTWTAAGFFVSAAGQGALLVPAGRLADTVGRRPAMRRRHGEHGPDRIVRVARRLHPGHGAVRRSVRVPVGGTERRCRRRGRGAGRHRRRGVPDVVGLRRRRRPARGGMARRPVLLQRRLRSDYRSRCRRTRGRNRLPRDPAPVPARP